MKKGLSLVIFTIHVLYCAANETELSAIDSSSVEQSYKTTEDILLNNTWKNASELKEAIKQPPNGYRTKTNQPKQHVSENAFASSPVWSNLNSNLGQLPTNPIAQDPSHVLGKRNKEVDEIIADGLKRHMEDFSKDCERVLKNYAKGKRESSDFEKKHLIMRENQLRSLYNTLISSGNPFVVSLRETFTQMTRLFMQLDSINANQDGKYVSPRGCRSKEAKSLSRRIIKKESEVKRFIDSFASKKPQPSLSEVQKLQGDISSLEKKCMELEKSGNEFASLPLADLKTLQMQSPLLEGLVSKINEGRQGDQAYMEAENIIKEVNNFLRLAQDFHSKFIKSNIQQINSEFGDICERHLSLMKDFSAMRQSANPYVLQALEAHESVEEVMRNLGDIFMGEVEQMQKTKEKYFGHISTDRINNPASFFALP